MNRTNLILLPALLLLMSFKGPLPDFSQINAHNFLASLASLKTSNETQADSKVYNNINSALKTLLFDFGKKQPSAIDRLNKLGKYYGTIHNTQTLYLLFIQLGKFIAYYGNTNSEGEKGKGARANSCFYSYNTQDAVEYVTYAGGVAGQLSTCYAATGSEGSYDLKEPVPPTVVKTRLCQGIVYYNNIIDILGHTKFLKPEDMGDIPNIIISHSTLMLIAETLETVGGVPAGLYNDGDINGHNAIATLKGITSQSVCEAITIERIQKWYAIFFETILQ